MKKISRTLPLVLILFAVSFFAHKANAQCGIKLVGSSSGCAPFTAEFERTDASGKTIVSVRWYYAGGIYSSIDSIVNLTFKNPGSYTIIDTVTYSDGTKCRSTYSNSIVVNSAPKPKIILPTDPILGTTQCFIRNGQYNNFTFTETTTLGSSGAAIVKYLWNTGDGDTSSGKTIKHTYSSPGTYNITVEVVDANGCIGYDTVLGRIVVLRDINSNFTANSSRACNRDSVQFNNDADTSGERITKYYWDFGDGSPLDSNVFSPYHIFYPGTYRVSFTIGNYLGCTSTYTQTITVVKFRIRIYRTDTICWSTASRNGVAFEADQQPGTVYWAWNFGDQASGQSDISNYNWVANHRFVGGPGNYIVNFTVTSSTCGTIDTCIIEHILGPQAIIDLPHTNTNGSPFPINNYYPATPMPRSAFIAVNNNKTSCGPQTITYITFHHNTASAVAHVKYKYCNATINSETVDTIKDCYGRAIEPLVRSVSMKPTDSAYSYYIDSTQDTTIWTKGSPIPSGKVYYPSSGTLTWNAMHDSNLTTCRLPNLVRFTNNSIKHRLYAAIDDNTFLNVLDPQHSFKDTCKWKSYPMASDSLSYYWSFNDPSGTNCTSTPSNINWNCNFSTEVAPYHYYKGTTGYPPSGYQSASLRVTDPFTGCSDSTIILLRQGAPDASWNKAAYCKMTWEMQESQLTPKGSPGPNGPPLIGFMLDQQPNACAGPNYPFKIDFSQTIPVSGAQHWWVVFDSANVVKYKHCSNPNDSTLDYGFLGDPSNGGYSTGLNGYPAGGPDVFWQNIPWQGNYWYQGGDSGCKTIGIVIQVGNCYDTAWYHDYICFNKLDPNFTIYNTFPVYGAVKSKTLVDSSESQHGHICQPPPTINWTPLSNGGMYDYSTNRPYINEGVRLYLYPKDTNQSDITSFQYNITRNNYGDNPSYTNSGGQWYYNMYHNGVSGFWPDSAVLNQFNITNDSVAQVKYHVNYIDTPHLYIIIPATAATAGLPPKRVLNNFPIYGTDTSGELDSLITNGRVNISLTDSRARRISAICGKPYVTVYADPGFKVLSHTQILRLGGAKAVDSFIAPGQVPQLSLPYPGFYTINSQTTNLEGCEQSQTYYLVYGHYATFWVDDSIICLGQPTTVHWYVRYWSTNCPPPPGGGPPPPGCLNGADEQAGISNTIDFAPWDYTGAPGGPTGYRDTLTNNAFKNSIPAGYQPEQIWFNYGIPGDTLFHRILVKGNSYKFPAYTKPGVYTITMKTVDWRGCNVFTQRRNLMQVIQLKANFSLEHIADTLAYCPPVAIPLYDSSTIIGNSYIDKYVKNGQFVDSTVVADSIEYQIWNTGYGNPVTRTGQLSNYIIEYLVADTFGVRLTLQAAISGCSSTVYKPHLVHVVGPSPKFEVLGNTSGCFPFTAHVRVISHDAGAKTHTWNFGDVVKQTNPYDLPEDFNSETDITTPGADSLTSLAYNQFQQGGHYRLTLTETDTFTDFKGDHITCTANYPLPGDSIQHFITVFPNSPIKLKGNGLLLNSSSDTLTAMSNYGEYKEFSWNFGNGSSASDSDSVAIFNYSAADVKAAKKDSKGRAIFMVTVTGTTENGCTATDSFMVLDGYSNIEEAVTGLENLNVYPNPFSNNATVEYQLDNKSKVSMDIMDITGKTIATISQADQGPGKYKFNINAEKYHLTPGVYLLKITLDNGFSVRHIVKM